MLQDLQVKDSKFLLTNSLKDDTENKINLIKFASEEKTTEQIKKDLNVKFDQNTTDAIIKLMFTDPKTLTTVLQNAKNKKTIEKEEREHNSSRPYVGQILYSSCGYDCTLITFYQVVKVTKCFAWVKQLKSAMTENVDGYGQQTMKRPLKNNFEDGCETLRRKIMPDKYTKKFDISISTYEYAKPWDGRDVYEDTLD